MLPAHSSLVSHQTVLSEKNLDKFSKKKKALEFVNDVVACSKLLFHTVSLEPKKILTAGLQCEPNSFSAP